MSEEIAVLKAEVDRLKKEHETKELEFSERIRTAEESAKAELEKAEAEKRQELADMELRFAEAQENERRKANKAYVEVMISDGKIPPAVSPGLAEFMSSLDTGTEFTFSETDKSTQAGFLRTFLDRVFSEKFRPLFESCFSEGKKKDTELDADNAAVAMLTGEKGGN